MPVLAAPRKPLDMPCMHDPLGQHGICKQTGVDNTLFNHFCKGSRGLRIDQMEPVFKSLGLALVDAGDGDTVTISKVRYEALRALAKDGI